MVENRGGERGTYVKKKYEIHVTSVCIFSSLRCSKVSFVPIVRLYFQYYRGIRFQFIYNDIYNNKILRPKRKNFKDNSLLRISFFFFPFYSRRMLTGFHLFDLQVIKMQKEIGERCREIVLFALVKNPWNIVFVRGDYVTR